MSSTAHPRTRARLRTWGAVAATVAAVTVAALAVATGQSSAATSSTTVTANVLSATSIGDTCTNPTSHALGAVTPGVATITPTSGGNLCSFSFGSSNDTAMLRMYQHDRMGAAMVQRGGTWATQSTPTTATLWDVAGFSGGPSGIATVVGDGQSVLTTANGGSTWTPRACAACPSTVYGVAIVRTASATQYAVGTSGGVVRSTDSGATWITQAAGAGSSDLYDVVAVDASHVWVVGQGGTIRFWNGASWAGQTRCSNVTAARTIVSITAADATHLYLHDDQGHVCVGNGSTWANGATTGAGLQAIVSADSTSDVWAFANGAGGTFFYADTLHSTGSAASWSTGPRNTNSIENIRGGAALSPTAAWEIGERGTIWKTADTGATWVQQDGAGGDTLTSISAVDANTAYVVGKGGTIAASVDGTHWTLQHATAGSQSLLDVASASDQVAWAVGASGTIRATTNGGATWTDQVSGTTQALRHVAVVDASNVVVVGDEGTILRTVDGGATWSTVASGTTARLGGVAIGSNGVGWAVGTASAVLRTDDGGASWRAQSAGSHGDFEGVDTTSPAIAVVVSSDGSIQRTTDGGATWSSTPSGAGWSAVAFASPSIGYAIGISNQNAVTTNGGATWSVNGSGNNESYDVAAVSTDVGFFGDIGGGATYTDDRTATWDPRLTPVSKAWGVDVPSDGAAWVVGEDAGIAREVPPATLSDYSLATKNWASAATNSLFGVCLQNVNASTTPVWTKDPGGTCAATDAHPWNAVPAAITKVAKTTVVGATGSVDLVWGLRAGTGQAPGTYSATVTVEVVAPDA